MLLYTNDSNIIIIQPINQLVKKLVILVTKDNITKDNL